MSKISSLVQYGSGKIWFNSDFLNFPHLTNRMTYLCMKIIYMQGLKLNLTKLSLT